jgi:hypothetical protein
MIIVPGMPVITQDLDTSLGGFDKCSRFDKGSGLSTRLRRSCFLVNAGKARCVKRLCGSFAASPGSL